ncbi:hypothetical protein K439DRAFT_1622366 [Ramaria rubella]|nr:hypothetical protein K439DRAFT_1622366 [Ramaria rubella]
MATYNRHLVILQAQVCNTTDVLLLSEWMLPVTNLLMSLQVTGSAIRGKRAFKLKVPSPDEPCYWTVIAATKDGEQLEDVVPSVSSVIIQGGKLELRIVPSSVVGETPGGGNKCERGFSTTSMDVAQEKKPQKDSPTPPESGAETDGDDVRAVDHKVRGGTHEPRFSRHCKAEKTEEVEDYLRGKLEEQPGWQEFRNAKGKVLTNPEVIRFYRFAYNFYKEFDTCRTQIYSALEYGNSWGNDMVAFMEQVDMYGPGGTKERPEVVERLGEVSGEPEGAHALVQFLKEQA